MAQISGNIEVDETYQGGERSCKRGRGAAGKAVIFGMLQRGGGIMTHVIPDAKTKSIRPLILNNVAKDSTINSDEWHAYKNLAKDGYKHQTVNHGKGEYANGDIHVNSLESYWAQLKKSIRSTHIHVSKKHLIKYAKEFEYRFNSRKNPEQMFPELISTFVDESES